MKVFIKDGIDLEKSVAEVFSAFGFGNLKDKNVFVKPNMLRVAKPEDCVITDPLLIKTVVSHLIDTGARIDVGDNPIPQKINVEEVAKQCGFFNASLGHYRNIGRYVKKVRIPHRLVKETYISREISECDVLISLPKFKTHQLTTFSSAIKNHFGIIPGSLKPQLHYLCPTLNDFCRLLINVYQIRPADLIIVDAIRVHDVNGREYGPHKIIAGDNGFAVDYVCGLMAGIKPKNDPLLKIAIADKLFDPDTVEIIGEVKKLKGFALPFSFPFRSFFAGLGSRLFSRYKFGFQPVVDIRHCTQCRACENACPKMAIKQRVIDYNNCINCYCCIEVCPNNAILKKFMV